jgi:hypothetical protein
MVILLQLHFSAVAFALLSPSDFQAERMDYQLILLTM